MVGVGGHRLVDHLEHPAGGYDVQHRQLSHPLGVVLGQAVGDAGAPVVAHQEEGIEPQLLHYAHLVLGHGALGILGMLRVAGGLAAVAVTPQVGGHHGEVPRQQRRNLVPHDVGLRIPVQQQHRWALAALDVINGGAIGLDKPALESFKHAHHLLGS